MSPVIDYTKSVYIKTLEADNKYRAIEELAGVPLSALMCAKAPKA